MAARDHGNIHRAAELRPATMVELLERCDAIRKPARFIELLTACEADHRGRLGFAERPYPQAGLWQQALSAARGVDAGAIAGRLAPEPRETFTERIRTTVHSARVAAVTRLGKGAQA
jgi:tRNA nucleotidyltransferase (CCA-adding enzyme)